MVIEDEGICHETAKGHEDPSQPKISLVDYLPTEEHHQQQVNVLYKMGDMELARQEMIKFR